MADEWAGMWITVRAQAEGNDRDGFRVAHYWDGQRFGHKSQAVRNGFTLAGSDDFNVGLVEGGSLVSLWWMEKDLGEDAETLAAIAAEIGVSRHA